MADGTRARRGQPESGVQAVTASHPRRLSRELDGRPAAPVRIVHLGCGSFFRSHQGWYTEHAPDAAEWGIAAFAGRSGATTGALAAQGGVYTLVERAAEGDRREVVSSVVAVSTGLDDWRHWFALPDLAVVTVTVTEAGYRRNLDGGLDRTDAEVEADIAALREAGTLAPVTSAPGKLALGLMVARDHHASGIAVVTCDNLPGNGVMLARILRELALAVDPGLAAWLESDVSFVTTVVDRITPRTTSQDVLDLRVLGVEDEAAVVAEPYVEWVLCGEFPRGRPAWEDVGARFVADIVPWEQRKLRLLNGAHSLMAYAAPLRGHETVAEAIADPEVRRWVDQWWDDAERHLPLSHAERSEYRSALVERFSNPRIRHLLAQIAADGSHKIPIRVLPSLHADLTEGRVPEGTVRILAAWVCHLRGHGAPVVDVARADLMALASGELDAAVGRVLSSLVLHDQHVHDLVVRLARELAESAPGARLG